MLTARAKIMGEGNGAPAAKDQAGMTIISRASSSERGGTQSHACESHPGGIAHDEKIKQVEAVVQQEDRRSGGKQPT